MTGLLFLCLQPACFALKRSWWWLRSLPVWTTCLCCITVMITSWWTSTGTSASTARCGTRNSLSRRNSGTTSPSWLTTAPIMDSGRTQPARNVTIPPTYEDNNNPDYHFWFSPRFCHQLDFSTSGALCVALNKAAAGQAYRCFKDRTVTKAYLAIVSKHRRRDLVSASTSCTWVELNRLWY